MKPVHVIVALVREAEPAFIQAPPEISVYALPHDEAPLADHLLSKTEYLYGSGAAARGTLDEELGWVDGVMPQLEDYDSVADLEADLEEVLAMWLEADPAEKWHVVVREV